MVTLCQLFQQKMSSHDTGEAMPLRMEAEVTLMQLEAEEFPPGNGVDDG